MWLCPSPKMLWPDLQVPDSDLAKCFTPAVHHGLRIFSCSSWQLLNDSGAWLFVASIVDQYPDFQRLATSLIFSVFSEQFWHTWQCSGIVVLVHSPVAQPRHSVYYATYSVQKLCWLPGSVQAMRCADVTKSTTPAVWTHAVASPFLTSRPSWQRIPVVREEEDDENLPCRQRVSPSLQSTHHRRVTTSSLQLSLAVCALSSLLAQSCGVCWCLQLPFCACHRFHEHGFLTVIGHSVSSFERADDTLMCRRHVGSYVPWLLTCVHLTWPRGKSCCPWLHAGLFASASEHQVLLNLKEMKLFAADWWTERRE